MGSLSAAVAAHVPDLNNTCCSAQAIRNFFLFFILALEIKFNSWHFVQFTIFFTVPFMYDANFILFVWFVFFLGSPVRVTCVCLRDSPGGSPSIQRRCKPDTAERQRV